MHPLLRVSSLSPRSVLPRLVLPWLVSAGLAVAGAAGAQTEIERTLPASDRESLEVELIAGSVTVAAWERDQVQVKGTLGRGVERVDFERDGGQISLEVETRRGRGDASAHLQVRVPRGLRVEIDTVSADVAIAGLDGSIEIGTVSGSVRIEGRPALVDIESVSGEVDLVDGARRASVETVSGAIVLRGAFEELEVSTVNAGVDLRTTSLGRGDFESVSGTLRLDVALGPRSDLSAESHSGGLDLRVPADLSARVVAETYSGRIRSDLGPAPQRASRYTSEQTLRFTVGTGEASVRLETFSGDLRLRVR